MAHYVCVTGGRDYAESAVVERVIDFLHQFYGAELRIMHGDAKGADRTAGSYAAQLGIKVKAFPAQWDAHGKGAGPIRNRVMGDYLVMCRDKGHTVQLVAFPGGRGTADMIAVANERGIPVDEIV
jgi:hypothetical protein